MDAGMKACFPAHNSPDNGERVRSLLCGREALARPSGMAGFIAKGVGFNVDESARSDERDSEGAPLRRGDVYIANVPWSFIARRER